MRQKAEYKYVAMSEERFLNYILVVGMFRFGSLEKFGSDGKGARVTTWKTNYCPWEGGKVSG